MEINIKKITDVNIMREACEMTFLGKSQMTLKKMYACEHSPCRTQIFWVRLWDIPLFCASQFVRHHVGSQAFQLSCRPDRKGGNNHFKDKIKGIIEEITVGEHDKAIEKLEWLEDHADRYTPVNLGLFLNAQSLIDIAQERLCSNASPETREIFSIIKAEIGKVDVDLARFLVPSCVYRGGICNRLQKCGYNKTELFKKQLAEYKRNFI